MSETLRLQKAEHEFRRFINELCPFPAEHVAIGEPDPEVKPFVEVKRSEALNVFLAKNPEFNEFREPLWNVRREQDKFCFIKEQWHNLTNEISA